MKLLKEFKSTKEFHVRLLKLTREVFFPKTNHLIPVEDAVFVRVQAGVLTQAVNSITVYGM
jgi:hypothetical protein